SDGNGSHASTLKSPSYTKSVSWQHYLEFDVAILRSILIMPVNGIFDVFDMLSIYIIYKLIVSNNT
ncbi:hypothetical protein ACK6TY_22390, partial [Escherichia coli]